MSLLALGGLSVFLHLGQYRPANERQDVPRGISLVDRAVVRSRNFLAGLNRSHPGALEPMVSGPFGIDAGAVLLTPDEFRFYNRFANQLVIGPTTPGNIHSIFNLDLGYSDILTMFSGMIPLDDEGMALSSYGVDENRYFLTLERDGIVHQYWVDPEWFVVSKYYRLDGRGKLMMDAKSSVRNDRRHGFLPRTVRFTFHKQQARVSIFYDRVKINVPDIHLTFSVPESAERVYW